jgi:putative endonuclease
MNGYVVHILANRPRGVLYVGVTNDLERRVTEHREGKGSAFCRKYNVHILVYSDVFQEVTDAIAAEKRIKKWRRAWKEKLIEEQNPEWRDQMPWR